MEMEKELYRAHPSMFRNNPLGFVLVLLLCVVGIGLLILLAWWISVLGTTLTITDKRTVLRKGILSKHTNEVLHGNVRNIQLRQGPLQRLFNVGYLGISSAGQGGIEIEVSGIPDPEGVKQLIDSYREM
jgi:uncharacterized membrane protein YdbT with pleckstrin-like domain